MTYDVKHEAVEAMLDRYAAKLNEHGYVVARPEHVGFQRSDDHSLEPLDTDEGYEPAGEPVFVLRSIKGEPPSLEGFDHRPEDED